MIPSSSKHKLHLTIQSQELLLETQNNLDQIFEELVEIFAEIIICYKFISSEIEKSNSETKESNFRKNKSFLLPAKTSSQKIKRNLSFVNTISIKKLPRKSKLDSQTFFRSKLDFKKTKTSETNVKKKEDIYKQGQSLNNLMFMYKYLKSLIQKFKNTTMSNAFFAKIKSDLQKLSKTVKFNFPNKESIHGDLSLLNHKGVFHKISLKNDLEYMGHFSNCVFHGKGKLWKKNHYTAQGYFEHGHLCGFGEKKYNDQSVYR